MGLRGAGAAAGTIGGSKGGLRVRMRMQRQVKQFFNSIGVVAEDALDNALTDVAMKIQEKTMSNLSQGFKKPDGKGTDQNPAGALDTGRLQNSIQMTDNYLEKRVGSNVKYAAHVEFGTGPGAGKKPYLPPYGKGSQLKSWGRSNNIDDIGAVALQIYRRGTKPRRYLGGAVFSEKTEVLHQFAEHLENAINDELPGAATVKVKRR
tara:strand:- start:97 stop:714 length:618 start_codon:yes stop_codon:yes gene_type:complete